MKKFSVMTLLGAMLPLVCVTCLTAGCSHNAHSTETLKVGIIPYDKPTKLREQFAPFAAYLAKKAGYQSSDVTVTEEYAGVLQALKSDQIDIAYLNPLSYALAVENFKSSPEHLIPIAMPIMFGKLTYFGDVFVRSDSSIHSMKDLKGKVFAFGDRTSSSGYLYPASMLMAAGIDPVKDIKYSNLNGPQVVLAVENKQADAGAIFDGGIELAIKDPVARKGFRIIATTPELPNGMLVARGNLDPEKIKKIRDAVLSMANDPIGAAALKKFSTDKWVAPDDHAFDGVRQKATLLGLHLKSLDGKG